MLKRTLRYWPWLIIAIPMLMVVAQVIGIQVNLYRGERASNQIAVALAEQFPGVKIRGGCSYEQYRVYITVYGVTVRNRQEEMRDWLAHRKVESRETVPIRLIFAQEGSFDDLAVFEL